MNPTTSKQLSDLPKEEKEFRCDFCDKTFEKNWILNLHMRTHEEKRLQCDYCQNTFSNRDNLMAHIKTIHQSSQNFQCLLCPKSFLNPSHF